MPHSLPDGVQLDLFPRAATSKTRLRAATTVLLIAVVSGAAANSLNYLSGIRPAPDAGEYVSGAMMLTEGRVLYKEIFEAKPPTIYILNALALSVGDGTYHSIRILERVLAVAGALLVFFIVLTVFERRSLAAVTAIAYSFYASQSPVIEEGNVTEEYAVVFVLARILCVVRAVLRDNRLSPRFSVLSGVCFSCAVLTKEPFIFWLAGYLLDSGSPNI